MHDRQKSAQAIADALHDMERCAKALEKATDKLHRVMWRAANDHGDELGIDVQPLSGGLPKPPKPE